MSTPRPVPFRVAHASSEEPDHPSRNLHLNLPQSRGWISGRSPPARFPQELVLQCAPAQLTHLRLMSHHCKISTRVELFARGGVGGDAQWVRIGHFSLDSNVRSNFQTRELRTVSLPPTQFVVTELRFLLHEPHANDFNSFNQVGIVSIEMLGLERAVEALPQQPRFGAAPQQPLSPIGAPRAAPAMPRPSAAAVEAGGACGALLRQLLEAKAAAVQTEDFAAAGRMKQNEIIVRQHASELAALDARKKQAVEAEEYEQATVAKEEMARVQATVAALAQRLGLGAPGGAPPQQGYAPMPSQPQPAYAAPPPTQPTQWGAAPAQMPPQPPPQQQPAYAPASPQGASAPLGGGYGGGGYEAAAQPPGEAPRAWADERPLSGAAQAPHEQWQQQPQAQQHAHSPASSPAAAVRVNRHGSVTITSNPIVMVDDPTATEAAQQQAPAPAQQEWADERPIAAAAEAPLPGGGGYNFEAFDGIGPDAVPGSVVLPRRAAPTSPSPFPGGGAPVDNADSRWSDAVEPLARPSGSGEVSFLLCTVTFYANLADSLTRSP